MYCKRLIALVCTAICISTLTVQAANVTISFVTASTNGVQPVDELQTLWVSPFGGWCGALWPFGLSVDDKPIMRVISDQEKQSTMAMKAAESHTADSALINQMLSTINAKEEAKEDVRALEINRKSSASIDLAPGAHTINPFGIQFTLAPDGISCTDPRVRVDSKARRIDVICHPVTIRTLAGVHSVPNPLDMTCGTTTLFLGLNNAFAELEAKNGASGSDLLKVGARRLTMYMPASGTTSYNVNNVKFDVDAAGTVKLAAATQNARCTNGRDIELLLPAQPPKVKPATQPVGVSFIGAGKSISVANTQVYPDQSGAGSAYATVPLTGTRSVSVGGASVRVPPTDPARPHIILLWDVAASAGWSVETAPLAARPGSQWSCRILPAGGKGPALPATLNVTLEATAGGPTGGEMALTSAAGVYTGSLPAKPGLWKLRASGDAGPLKGRTLGVVAISEATTAAVSLFTVNNRALQRRGAPIDMLWVARRNPGAAAAEWPVRLRGIGLDAVVATISIPAATATDKTTDISGRLLIDTTALTSGDYTIAAEADGVAGYPFRFRISQRERLSDFDVYSWPIHTTAAVPFPGSPVNAYLGGVNMNVPGVTPFLADGDGALDGIFGAYANAPLGPLTEMFARPGPEERAGMARAALGLHYAPTWPEAHSYESSNPKHTLPENLAWVRRRMALFAQTHADYPGIDGFDYNWNWQTSGKGYWGDSGPGRLDAWQPEAAQRSEEVAWKLTQKMWPDVVAKYANLKPVRTAPPEKWPKELADIPGLTESQLQYVHWVAPNGWQMRLPNTFAEWYADLNEILPGLTHHAHVSSCGLGGGIQYWEWYGKTHRASIDMSERFMSPFDGWISPAIMAMDNQQKQKVQLAIQSHAWRSEDIPSLFAAAGRGVDGFAFTEFSDKSDQDFIGRGRVFERFGSWFVSFDPLPDVALFASRDKNAVRTALHDLARIRRPAVMVGPRDVESGELLKYKVLLLLGLGDELPPDTLSAFRAFEAKGGVILKDDACHKNVPGRSIGLAYQGKTLAGSWGGAQAGGEYEHIYVWKIFQEKQDTLVKAFADTPRPPVTTPDTDVLLSPLAGKDSIICFVINKTEIPLEINFPDEKSSRFRQSQVLPKVSELQVEKGWYVHNLLTGKPAPAEDMSKGLRVPVSLTGAEGEVYLLTRRKPENMVITAERASPSMVRLSGGLVDGQGKPLADPMPFEVTLKGPNGTTLFHKFASIGPEHPFELPVPAMSAGTRPELVIRDLVLGTTATQTLEPSTPATVAVRQLPDVIGGEKKILDFLTQRKGKGPVTILLDEGQDAYRPAAEKLAALLKTAGRETQITTLDPTAIEPLHLRWYPQPEDIKVLNSVTNNRSWAWRVNMSISASSLKDKTGKTIGVDYAQPSAGYAEMGPRLRHDADVVLFGTPGDHRAVADLAPWLRRVPTDNYPAPGGFFVHYLWSPFRATYDAIYIGCRDVAGAEAAVACIASLKPPEPTQLAKTASKPLTIRGGQPAPLENMQTALGGTPVLNLEYSPSGKRLFAATFAYGDWLFAMDTDGKVLEHIMPPETEVWPSWYRWGRWATPLSDTLLQVHLWNSMYNYELGQGWLSKSAKSPILEDKAAGRAYMGGTDRLLALDPQGRVLWTYQDVMLSPDLTTQREVTPRALNGDKSVLLVSASAKGEKGTTLAPSVLGLDSATGKIRWSRDGIALTSGKVVPLPDRFLIMADDGSVHELTAQDGLRGTAMTALTGRPDWVLEAPDRKLLIAENNHFNRQGPSCRVYLRSLAGGPDQDINIQGRVTVMELAPDKRSFVVATTAERLLKFSIDGTMLWQTEAPMFTIARISADGTTIAAAGADGVARVFNAADGKLRTATDLNAYNVITAEAYAKQKRMGQLPFDSNRTPQPVPPEPSYGKTLSGKPITFGPNLAPAETMRTLLQPVDTTATDTNAGYRGKLAAPVKLPAFKTTAGTTYLVEMLTLSATPTNASPLLRVEVSVKGRMTTRNMPYTARLPVGKELVRYRAAFRSDEDDEVTLTLRPVVPRASGKAGTYDDATTSETPAIIGDVFVSSMTFPGPNVMFDGGPDARSKPAGSFTCTALPAEDGDSSTVEAPADCTDAALRLVNGQIANQRTDWVKVTGGKYGPNLIPLNVKYAEATASIKAKALKAIVVYEDNTGPVASPNNTPLERTAMRYCVDVHNATGNWVRVGAVCDNRQLINIFPCPAYKIDGIRYIWAGARDDSQGRTDGFVRSAQIEAYASENITDAIEKILIKAENELPPPSDGF